MRKGAIPVPYIIALLLGIAVIAILGYWFFVLGGKLGGEVTVEGCKTKRMTYCGEWAAFGYTYKTVTDPDTGVETETDEPVIGYWDDYAEGCTDIGVTVGTSDATGCKQVLGQG